MNVQENKELWKHLAGISKEVTVLSTMMKEIVVPGIKKSGIKWDENDKLDLKGTVKAVKEIANQFDGLRVEQINIKNDHENLKIYVTDRFKVCFMLIFFLFSAYSSTVFLKVEKAFDITGLLGF
jgi:hypothetical protein|tara:strand:- start:1515 stop:1886 length:372 start_codon:yes stop_codon:yes gene_type:complete